MLHNGYIKLDTLIAKLELYIFANNESRATLSATRLSKSI